MNQHDLLPPIAPDVLGPGEDPERKPGGFPHPVVAITAGVVVAIAALLLYGLIKQSVVVLVGCALLVPVLILIVTRRASRTRDTVHRSR